MKSKFGILFILTMTLILSSCSDMNKLRQYEISQTIDGVIITRITNTTPHEMLQFASKHPNISISAINY